MRYFVIAYSPREGILQMEDFDEAALPQALELRARLQGELPRAEVALLSARDRAMLERTHARYFRSPDQLLSSGEDLAASSS